MTSNPSPFYQRAEQEYQEAKTDEERIACLEIMMKEMPKHKSSENLRRNLTNRYKKLKEGVAKQKSSGKSTQVGIKKAEMQCVLVGLPNSGKSTIFNLLTNQEAKTSEHPFTTYEPQLGTFKFEDAPIQIIDDSPIPNHNKSLVNSADTLLITINNIEEIQEIEKAIWKSPSTKIYLFNKTDLLNENELRKLKAKLKSQFPRLKFIFINQNIKPIELEKIKRKIFETFPIIRIYTKEPKKAATDRPMIMKKNSTLAEASEKILKGLSKKIKKAKIWGPSSKFGGQVVGLDHILKDKDIIELQTA